MNTLRTIARELRVLQSVISEPDAVRLSYLATLHFAGLQDHAAARRVLGTAASPASMIRATRALAGWSFASALYSQHRPPVIVAPSGLGAGSGNGLVAAGARIQPGELVAVYPGALYAGQTSSPHTLVGGDDGRDASQCHGPGLGPTLGPHEDAGRQYGLGEEGEDVGERLQPPAGSAYSLFRSDAVRLDAGDVAHGHALQAVQAVCPWAVGHLAQHPPAGTAPNVVEICINIPILPLSRDGVLQTGALLGEEVDVGEATAARAHIHSSAGAKDALSIALGELGQNGGSPWLPIPRPWLSHESIPQLPYWWPPAPVLSGAVPPPGQAIPLALQIQHLHSLPGSETAWERMQARWSHRLHDHLSSFAPASSLATFLASPSFVRRARELDAHETLALFVMPVTVLVAVADIAPGEEVWLDYGFMPDPYAGSAAPSEPGVGTRWAARRRLPEWYTPVSADTKVRLEQELEERLRAQCRTA